MLEPDERRAIEATLGRFTANLDRTLFAGEGPDGDLGAVPALLDQARKMDLLADPSPGAPGYELGVWGRACWSEGPRRSLLTLSLLGESCAGFATAIHAQGLACLSLDDGGQLSPATPLAAVFMPEYGIPLSARMRSVTSGLWLTTPQDVPRWNGGGYFLLAAEAPEKLVCFARRVRIGSYDPEWISLLMDAGEPGVKLTEVMPAHRIGLRAARQYHLRCKELKASQVRVLHEGTAALRSLIQVLACDWLGQGAIALGVARRSLRDSRAYTAQRYQGGRIIQEHASIQLLQGTAQYDIALLEAILYRYADEPLSSFNPVALLRWAIQARLAVVEHAHRAVTDCLQTLGGYGYMADYGFEKRLRDVSTLKSLHGAPDQLKLFLNELTQGGKGG